METEGNELYQWRKCPAPGTGEVPAKKRPNRTGPVQFISTVKTGRGRQTQRVQLVQLHPQSVSFKTSAP